METPLGPSESTLRHLKGMMENFVAQKKAQQTFRVGKPVAVLRPRKCCPVCGLLYDKVHMRDDVVLDPKPCEKCEAMFRDGCIALVCGDQYAFVRSPRFEGMTEKIVHLQPQNFHRVKEEFDAQWNTKEKDENNSAK